MVDVNQHLGGFERPTAEGGRACATPSDATMITLLGGMTFQGVTFTRGQAKALEKFYGYDDQKARRDASDAVKESWKLQTQKVMDRLKDPKLKDWKRNELMKQLKELQNQQSQEETVKGAAAFAEAGGVRNRWRIIQEDGLRVMAMLGRFLEPGQDPVKLVVQLMSEAGYDVSEHCEWAYDESDIEEMAAAS